MKTLDLSRLENEYKEEAARAETKNGFDCMLALLMLMAFGTFLIGILVDEMELMSVIALIFLLLGNIAGSQSISTSIPVTPLVTDVLDEFLLHHGGKLRARSPGLHDVLHHPIKSAFFSCNEKRKLIIIFNDSYTYFTFMHGDTSNLDLLFEFGEKKLSISYSNNIDIYESVLEFKYD